MTLKIISKAHIRVSKLEMGHVYDSVSAKIFFCFAYRGSSKMANTQQVYDESNQTYLMFEVPDIANDERGSIVSATTALSDGTPSYSSGRPQSYQEFMSPAGPGSPSPLYQNYASQGAQGNGMPKDQYNKGAVAAVQPFEMEPQLIKKSRWYQSKRKVASLILLAVILLVGILLAVFLSKPKNGVSSSSAGSVTNSTILPLVGTNVITLAGNGSVGTALGSAKTIAAFNYTRGVAAGADGMVYISDFWANRIVRLTPDGNLVLFAGSGANSTVDGTGAEASFANPWGIAFDPENNLLVAESAGHVIRRITPSGVVTTIAGTAGTRGYTNGQGIAAVFNTPRGLTVAPDGTIFVSDSNNQRIRKIAIDGTVTAYAGTGSSSVVDGPNTVGTINEPRDLALAPSGDLYYCEYNGHKIRKISPAGLITTVVGSGISGAFDGQGLEATLYNPQGVAIDANGFVYFSDSGNNKIRIIAPSGAVSTFAGNGGRGSLDGVGQAATFYTPGDLTIDSKGDLIIADTFNNKVRKIIK